MAASDFQVLRDALLANMVIQVTVLVAAVPTTGTRQQWQLLLPKILLLLHGMAADEARFRQGSQLVIVCNQLFWHGLLELAYFDQLPAVTSKRMSKLVRLFESHLPAACRAMFCQPHGLPARFHAHQVRQHVITVQRLYSSLQGNNSDSGRLWLEATDKYAANIKHDLEVVLVSFTVLDMTPIALNLLVDEESVMGDDNYPSKPYGPAEACALMVCGFDELQQHLQPYAKVALDASLVGDALLALICNMPDDIQGTLHAKMTMTGLNGVATVAENSLGQRDSESARSALEATKASMQVPLAPDTQLSTQEVPNTLDNGKPGVDSHVRHLTWVAWSRSRWHARGGWRALAR